LDIPVLPLSTYRELSAKTRTTLTRQEQGAFSAMIVFAGRRRVVIHNDAHALTRQRANICHELAHALLIHEPQSAQPGEPLAYNTAQEDEAKWLGAVIQVPDEACLHACRNGHSIENAARRMGVSMQLMRWRYNVSGAEARVARARGGKTRR
jgi:Zn-dependent peptidase ImmA (M78 family)